MKTILITGCAGFIGFHISLSLLKQGKLRVIGIDNINDYYDPKIKIDRLNILKKNDKFFKFIKSDIKNRHKMNDIFKKYKFNYIVHLAAQAGVRYSVENPTTYVDNNINGFFNILDCSRIYKVEHFIYASTSSVYGSSKDFPLKEVSNTDKPNSFYAASKKANEVMAYSYSYIYKFPTTGLRFFTVYGPKGRPDMALYSFAESIYKSKTISLFNKGNHIRDFTYIDDVVSGIMGLINRPSKKSIPYEIYNVGSSKPSTLKKFLSLIEKNIGKKTKIKLDKFQLGDVHKTHASINKLNKKIGYKPKTNIEEGIKNFINWYKTKDL